MATKIGCDNLVIAKMSTEETATTAPTYATPVRALGVMSININPNASLETLFADDGPMENASTLGKIEVEIQKNELTYSERALLLGHQIDTSGVMTYGDSDTAPYVAIGFRSLKSNGKYRYVWLLKGKFSDPEDANETKGDSINFQSETIKGQFVRLSKTYTPTVGQGETARAVRPWKTEADEENSAVTSSVISGWFTAVHLPTA